MPVFDLELQRMCVRIVYDGVAAAGKTTNLRQLCNLFATQRSTEIYSPADLRGRTLYFDWVQISAGVVCGFPLMCQVISVPGQVVLTPRRRHLLASADAVVYVCDSAESGAVRARHGLSVLEEVAKERGADIPIVVQANKQDQVDALSGTEVLEAIGLRAVPVIEAIATDGVGVVDTFVSAVRAVIRMVQSQAEGDGFRVAVRRAETPDVVLTRLSKEEVDPEWAAEMLLEEASDAFLLTAASTPQPEGDAAPSANAAHRQTSPPIPDRAATAMHESSPGDVPPTVPTDDVPTGCVWPAHTGRAILRKLALANTVGGSQALGDYVFTTTRTQRFLDMDSARHALVRSAREMSQLGALLAPDTVLVVQPAGDGSSWLWTIAARVPNVLEGLAGQPGAAPSEVGEVLAALGSAVVDALRISARNGLCLDLHPRSFGLRESALRYIGDVGSLVSVRGTAAANLMDGIEAAVAQAVDPEPYIEAIERGISTRVTYDDVVRLRLATELPCSEVCSDIGRQARDRIAFAVACVPRPS